jgi:hypothetical protein
MLWEGQGRSRISLTAERKRESKTCCDHVITPLRKIPGADLKVRLKSEKCKVGSMYIVNDHRTCVNSENN